MKQNGLANGPVGASPDPYVGAPEPGASLDVFPQQASSQKLDAELSRAGRKTHRDT